MKKIIVIVGMLIFFTVPSGALKFVVGLILFPFMFSLIKELLPMLFKPIIDPLRFLHRLFTNTLPGGKVAEAGYYPNKTQYIIFGIGGNIAYYLTLVFLFFLIFPYRPYADGYICKESTFEVGDVVVIKNVDEKSFATVQDFFVTEEDGNCVVLATNNGTVTAGVSWFDGVSIDNRVTVKGLYVESDENFFVQFGKSAWYSTVYAFEKIPRIIELIKSDFE